MKHRSLFITTGLVLIAVLLFTTCAKEYSYEGGNQPGTSTGSGGTPAQAIASYTLVGTPNNCMDAKVNGIYLLSKKLDATNSINVMADVTSPGLYSLTTDTIENISFSANGTFNDTGIHVVALQGNGVPQLSQNLLFKLSGSTSSCTIPVSVLPSRVMATYVLESDYDSSCAAFKSAGIAAINKPLSSSNTISVHVYTVYVGSYTISTKTVNGMIFYGTGEFTTTGYQYVTLTGSGTPLVSGTTTFTPSIVGPHPIGGESCTFDMTVQ